MKLKLTVLYGVFFVVAIVFFTIVLFPEKQAAVLCSNFFNQTFSTVRCNIGSARLKFPAGLELTDTEWTGFDSIHIKPEKMILGVLLPSVFKPVKDMTFSADINHGKAKGLIRQIRFSHHDFSSLSISFSNVQIADFSFQTEQYPIKVSCDAGGQFEYLKKSNSSTGNIVFLNFTADLPDMPGVSRIGMKKLVFNRVELEFATENEKIVISKCSARGPEMNVDLEGTLVLGEPSTMGLKGYIRPNPSFVSKLSAMASVTDLFQDSKGKGIPVSISGTIHNPVIRFK
ncbi:MAG: type II secretion system protein GspN [Pseudomonadota bacterium]